MFVHLHVYSDYSLLRSCITIDDWAEAAARSGMTACALTDRFTMAGAVDLFRACQARGLKPLYGLELSVQQGSAGLDLVALAENSEGYRVLLQWASQPPPLSWELFQSQCRGLIVLSGTSQNGLFSRVLDRTDEAGILALWRRTEAALGPEQFFVQLETDAPAKKQRSQMLYRVLRPAGAEFVLTHKGTMLTTDQSLALSCMQALRSGGSPSKFGPVGLPLFSATRMEQEGQIFPGAAANTAAIAERCNVVLPSAGGEMPNVSSHGSLYETALAELQRHHRQPTPAMLQRLKHECAVIDQLHFGDYFLITADIVRWAKDNGIPVGPGRGSAAGSFTAYALGITAVNPLDYGLLFERFLNLHRRGLPDIDLDFCAQRRDEVAAYVRERFGGEHTAHIGAYGTFGVRSALREAGRALGADKELIDYLVHHLGRHQGDLPWNALAEQRPAAEQLLQAARGLFKKKRNETIHAAGIVISPKPLQYYTALRPRRSAEPAVTQLDMDSIAALGLLKIDILGLRTLTILDAAEKMVQRKQPSFVLKNTDRDDPASFALLARGNTTGIFQLESGLFRDLLRDIKPTSMAELCAVLALGRPGPLSMASSFARRKSGKEEPKTLHPLLEPILQETYGLMLYQEQVMQAAHVVGGLPLAAADELRSAMSKKQGDKIKQWKVQFLAGAEAKGLTAAEAADTFAAVEAFGGYAFNKSHSASYAQLSYEAAFLKTHYPAEFFAALLHFDQSHSREQIIMEVLRTGIPLMAPDLRFADVLPQVEGNAIRLGLTSIKSLSRAEAADLTDVPAAGMQSLPVLVRRLSLNSGTAAALIKAGALDFLDDRPQVWKELRKLFPALEPAEPNVLQWAKYEKDELGLEFRYHPAVPWQPLLEPLAGPGERFVAGEILQLTSTGRSVSGLLYTAGGRARWFKSYQQKYPWTEGSLVCLFGSDEGTVFAAHWLLPLTQWILLAPGSDQMKAAAAVIQRYPGSYPVLLALADKVLQVADPSLWTSADPDMLKALAAKNISVRTIRP